MQVRITTGGEAFARPRTTDYTALDMYPDENVNLIKTIKNTRDVSKIFTEFTQAFSMPASKRNNTFFNHYYNIDVSGGYDAHTKVPARIEVNYLLLVEGVIELVDVVMKDDKPSSYSVNFYGLLKSLKTLFGDARMNELDTTALAYLATFGNVTNSWQGLLHSGDVVIPLVDFQRGWIRSTGTGIDPRNIFDPLYGILLEELKPAIRLGKLVEIMFNHVGLTISGNFLNTDWFRRVYILPSLKAGYMDWVEANYKMIVRDNGLVFIGTGVGVVPFPNETYDTGGLWDNTTHTFRAYKTGTYNFLLTGIHYIGGGTINFFRTVGGVGLAIGSSNGSGWFGIHFSVALTVGQLVQITASATAANQQLEVCTLTMKGAPTGFYNSSVNVGDRFDDTKIMDFLSGIARAYNLVFIPNGIDDVKIMTLDDYYASGDIKDISKHVDLTKVKKRKTEVYELIDFKLTEAAAATNKDYKDRNTKLFGQETYRPGFDFQSGSLEVAAPFSVVLPSFVPRYNAAMTAITGETDIKVIRLLDENEKPVHVPYLAFFLAGVGQNADSFYYQTGETAGVPVIAGTHIFQDISTPYSDEIPQSDSLALTFSQEQYDEGDPPLNTMYATFWQSYIERIYASRTRLIDVEAVIPIAVALELALNDILYFGGDYHTINQSIAKLLEGRTTLELLGNYDVSDFFAP